MGWRDDSTQLLPDDGFILEYCFIAAAIVALASIFVALRQSSGALFARIILALLGFGLSGGLSTLLLTSVIARIVSGYQNFPPEKTRTFTALLPIGRAYRMDSRTGSSWIIQPTPLWTNIDITRADYDLMAARVATTEKGREPEDVPSKGFFCAKVTMQQAGEALRVLHAGSYELPKGSIVRCPLQAVDKPYLELA